MSAAAVTLNLITLFVRYLWSRRQPRPSWTEGDFHVNPLPPAPGSDQAGLGTNKDLPAMPYPHFGESVQDQPPSW